MSSCEVIDLTQSPISKQEDPIVIQDSDDDDEATKPNGNHRKVKRRKRKKKAGISAANSGASTPVLAPSNSGEKRKHVQLEEGEVEDDPSHSRRNHSRSPITDLFYEDFGIASAPSHATSSTMPSGITNTATDLLLPSHVSVFGAPVEILPTFPSNSDDEDFIEFLDTDDRKGMVRYFDEPEDEEAEITSKRRIVCRRCHEEGHIQADCKLQICLTCGAKNEHSTYSCPVNKVCFNCGMKGHLSSQCRQVRGYAQRNASCCYRCGDEEHQTNECPSLWRVYTYLSVEESAQVLEARKAKSELKLGQGGEAYIATDEWCYNCGESGHWGDDCNAAFSKDHPIAPSAFGAYNVNQGPFSTNGSEYSYRLAMKRKPRDWESESLLPADWGAGAPGNVGKLGRRKERERMAKRHQQLDDDDEGDFFNKLSSQPSTLKIKGSAKSSGSTSRSPKAMRFNLPDRPRPPKSPPSLLQRMESGRDRDRDRDRDKDRERDRGRNYHGSSSRKPSYRRDHSPNDYDRDRRKEYRKDKDSGWRKTSDSSDRRSDARSRDREPSRFGPQYKGGYSR